MQLKKIIRSHKTHQHQRNIFSSNNSVALLAKRRIQLNGAKQNQRM